MVIIYVCVIIMYIFKEWINECIHLLGYCSLLPHWPIADPLFLDRSASAPPKNHRTSQIKIWKTHTHLHALPDSIKLNSTLKKLCREFCYNTQNTKYSLLCTAMRLRKLSSFYIFNTLFIYHTRRTNNTND